jgi:hypothetical protein
VPPAPSGPSEKLLSPRAAPKWACISRPQPRIASPGRLPAEARDRLHHRALAFVSILVERLDWRAATADRRSRADAMRVRIPKLSLSNELEQQICLERDARYKLRAVRCDGISPVNEPSSNIGATKWDGHEHNTRRAVHGWPELVARCPVASALGMHGGVPTANGWTIMPMHAMSGSGTRGR